jgi:single-stranded DNA-binding protein
MHLNSCLMIGRVSPKGPQLRYAENGTPICSFILEVDELTHGQTFTTWIPCEISGKYAEQTAGEVEAGDVLQIAGKWKYKSTVDQKSGAKVSKPVVSSWGVSQRIAATTSGSVEPKCFV